MVLGPASGLRIQRAQAHATGQNALSRQGLQRLTQIAMQILYSVAAVSALLSLAIVTAAAAAIVAIPGYMAAGVAPAVALRD